MAANAEGRNTELGKSKYRKSFRVNDLLILLIVLIIFAIVAGSLLIFAIRVLFKKEARPYRLPTDVVPYQYELEVKPYLIPEYFEFEGQVEIYVACVRTTDLIVLHSKELTIFEESVKVTNIEGGDDLRVLLIDYDRSNDLLLLRMLDDLKERRRYRIYIKYKGSLGKDAKGFYVMTYEDYEESTHYVASTQFEPEGARMAFPCFDEPAFKSTFNLTLVRWKNTTSLSNMPRIRTEYRGENWEADVFEKSLRMSTYLVAFVFCDYVGSRRGKITVWAPAHKKDKAKFALNVSSRALQFFEERLNIPYSCSKLDMVPVPKLDISAMENWGLIIFQELYLLTQEGSEDDVDSLSDIASTVAHEIAHQWFGNLVTPKWWSDIWLSEGITTYMQDLAMITLFPEWNQIDPTILTAYSTIKDDCTDAASLWHPVSNSKDAEESFEGVTYEKGGMITRMLHQILGEEVFWNGIKRYLKSNKYENVEEADLWRYLTTAQSLKGERLDVAEVMHSWTRQSGMPIVTVHRDYRRNTAMVSQESCKSNVKEHKNDLWHIPLIFETRHAVNLFNNITWLKQRNMSIGKMPGEDDWIVVNGDSTGNYLVNYDRQNWNLLSEQLRHNHEVFEPTERYKFVTEIIKLKKMGYAEVDTVFQISLYMTDETEVRIVQCNCNFIKNYLTFFNDKKYYELMTEYIFHNWEYPYERFGWKEQENGGSKTWIEMDVRTLVTKTICQLNFPDCVKEATRRYATVAVENTDVTEMYHEAEWIVLCTILQNATYRDWKSMKESHFSNDEQTLRFVLECSHDPSIIQGELHVFLNESYENIGWLVVALTYSEVAFNEFLNFFDKNFQRMKEKGFDVSALSWKDLKALYGINVSRVQKVIQMFNKYLKELSGSDATNVETFLELLKKKLPLLEKETEILKNWLEEKPWLIIY